MYRKGKLLLSFDLSEIPPSVNSLTVNKKGVGRISSPRYSKWQSKMLREVSGLSGVIAYSPVVVAYGFKRPDNRRRDLGNMEKAVSDLLVKAGVIFDDSLIVSLRLDWHEGPPMSVSIWEAKER